MKKQPAYKTPKSPELANRNSLMFKDRMMGISLNDLARRYGLSRSHVHRIVSGIPVVVQRPRPTKKSRKRPEREMRFMAAKFQALELRRRGFSYREIAERTGTSHGFAHKHTRRCIIRQLEGNAWQGGQDRGRPKEWKRSLMAHTTQMQDHRNR